MTVLPVSSGAVAVGRVPAAAANLAQLPVPLASAVALAAALASAAGLAEVPPNPSRRFLLMAAAKAPSRPRVWLAGQARAARAGPAASVGFVKRWPAKVLVAATRAAEAAPGGARPAKILSLKGRLAQAGLATVPS